MRIFRYAKVVILAPAVGSAAIGIAGLVLVGGVLIAGRGRFENRANGRQSASAELTPRNGAGHSPQAGAEAGDASAVASKSSAAASKSSAVASKSSAAASKSRPDAAARLGSNQAPPQAPEKRVADPRRKPTAAHLDFTKLIDSGDLQFLGDYAGRAASDADGRQKVRTLVGIATPYTPYHFGADFPLPQVLDSLLIGGDAQPVAIQDGRYATVSGLRIAAHNRAGLLWVDMREGIALGAIYFDPTNGEPSPTLTIFSRQLDQRTVRMSQLPQVFVDDLSRWAIAEGVPPILTRYFIGASGAKYVLKHEENYCASPEGVAAPAPKATCEEMNAQAALIDLEAAKFLEQTHNASNATIRTISSTDHMN